MDWNSYQTELHRMNLVLKKRNELRQELKRLKSVSSAAIEFILRDKVKL